jgi:hypothetical protein
MKNRELELQHYPTSAELYALERAAKAARGAELARLVSAAIDNVKSLFATTGEMKGVNHA